MFSTPPPTLKTIAAEAEAIADKTKDAPPRDDTNKDVGRRFASTKTLGTGTFSVVKLATHTNTGCTVALKIMSKAKTAASGAEGEHLDQEITNLRLCARHMHIIKLYDVIDTPESMQLVTECASGGQLKSYVMANTCRGGRHGEGLPPDEARRFFQQLIGGIEHMHSGGVIHRDLKMENLLLDAAHRKLKIVDFGLSKRVDLSVNELLRTSCGSPRHAAPEVMSANPNRPYAGPPVDIWSAGVVLYAMLTAHLPFRGDDVEDILPKVVRGEYRMPPSFTWGIRQLIEGMICVDPAERWTIGRIREDSEWFKRNLPRYLVGRTSVDVEVEEERRAVDGKVVEEVVRRYNERGGLKVTSDVVELALAAKDASDGGRMGANEETDDDTMRDLRVAYSLVLDEEGNKNKEERSNDRGGSEHIRRRRGLQAWHAVHPILPM